MLGWKVSQMDTDKMSSKATVREAGNPFIFVKSIWLIAKLPQLLHRGLHRGRHSAQVLTP